MQCGSQQTHKPSESGSHGYEFAGDVIWVTGRPSALVKNTSLSGFISFIVYVPISPDLPLGSRLEVGMHIDFISNNHHR